MSWFAVLGFVAIFAAGLYAPEIIKNARRACPRRAGRPRGTSPTFASRAPADLLKPEKWARDVAERFLAGGSVRWK